MCKWQVNQVFDVIQRSIKFTCKLKRSTVTNLLKAAQNFVWRCTAVEVLIYSKPLVHSKYFVCDYPVQVLEKLFRKPISIWGVMDVPLILIMNFILNLRLTLLDAFAGARIYATKIRKYAIKYQPQSVHVQMWILVIFLFVCIIFAYSMVERLFNHLAFAKGILKRRKSTCARVLYISTHTIVAPVLFQTKVVEN